MAFPAKSQPELPQSFRDLLRKADISLVHMSPRNPASLGVSIAADTADVLRGLAKAYEVMPRDIIRAAIVIGLEELLGCAEELGHAAQETPD
jgi:hypothetical protein